MKGNCIIAAADCKSFMAVDLLVFAGGLGGCVMVLPPLVSSPLDGCRLPSMGCY
jgi:hypothetical protein